MTQETSGGATPPSVAGPATETVVLPRNTPMVIGIFGPDQGLSAMIRMPNGRITTVHRGDKVNGRQVVRIDAKGVVVVAHGREDRFAMP